MREKKLYYIVTFSHTAEAMAFEKKCISENISGRLIPLPVEISAGCGLAWRMTKEEYEKYSEAITGFEGIYTLKM